MHGGRLNKFSIAICKQGLCQNNLQDMVLAKDNGVETAVILLRTPQQHGL